MVKKMDLYRKTAIIVGVLFIAATVTSVIGGLLVESIIDSPDDLVNVSENENQVILGVLLELTWAASAVAITVLMFPILKKQNEGLALGYVGARIFEGVIAVVGAISGLLLITLSQEFVIAGAPDATYFQAFGTLLLGARDLAWWIGPMIVFALSALIFNYLLYHSKLIPRWLSVWGFIGATLLLAEGLLGMFDLTISTFLAAPIAVQEMVLAVWLIVKGFNPSAIASKSAKKDTN